MTRDEIRQWLTARAEMYIRQGFEPEVAISKAGADFRDHQRRRFADALAFIQGPRFGGPKP